MNKSSLAVLSLSLLGATLHAQETQTTVSRPLQHTETKQYVDAQGRVVNETTTVTKQVEITSTSRDLKTAIFVSNRAGEKYDASVMPMEDFVTAKVADKGFEIISREIVADSLRSFDPATASAGRAADSLDTKLTEQSSALRLAQNLGANYLLVANITSIGSRDRTSSSYGVNMATSETTLRVTYKIIDGSNGTTLTADSFKVSDSVRQTENATESNSDLLAGLMEEAAGQLAQNLEAKVRANKIKAVKVSASLVNMTINVEVADVAIPDIRLSPDNTVGVYHGKTSVSPVNATVEIDGVAVGSVPGTIQVRPGFSKLRVVREGFRPWERTINAVNGQTLTVALEMTDEAMARWRANTAFLNDLKNGAKLTDAQVEVLKGQAKMLSESGYKVNIKIDADEAPTIINKSLF